MKLMADSDVDLGCDKRRDKTRECLCQLVQKLDINFTKLPLPPLPPLPPTHRLSSCWQQHCTTGHICGVTRESEEGGEQATKIPKVVYILPLPKVFHEAKVSMSVCITSFSPILPIIECEMRKEKIGNLSHSALHRFSTFK